MEAKFKGTKGNWFLNLREGFIETIDDDIICSLQNCTNSYEEEANGRLIAAAPNLLEALTDLVKYCEENETFAELELAKNAINKALS